MKKYFENLSRSLDEIGKKEEKMRFSDTKSWVQYLRDSYKEAEKESN